MVWHIENVLEYQHYLSTDSSVKFNEMLSIIERQTVDNLASSVNKSVVAFTNRIRLDAEPLFLKRFDIGEGTVMCINDKKTSMGNGYMAI